MQKFFGQVLTYIQTLDVPANNDAPDEDNLDNHVIAWRKMHEEKFVQKHSTHDMADYGFNDPLNPQFSPNDTRFVIAIYSTGRVTGDGTNSTIQLMGVIDMTPYIYHPAWISDEYCLFTRENDDGTTSFWLCQPDESQAVDWYKKELFLKVAGTCGPKTTLSK